MFPPQTTAPVHFLLRRLGWAGRTTQTRRDWKSFPSTSSTRRQGAKPIQNRRAAVSVHRAQRVVHPGGREYRRPRLQVPREESPREHRRGTTRRSTTPEDAPHGEEHGDGLVHERRPLHLAQLAVAARAQEGVEVVQIAQQRPLALLPLLAVPELQVPLLLPRGLLPPVPRPQLPLLDLQQVDGGARRLKRPRGSRRCRSCCIRTSTGSRHLEQVVAPLRSFPVVHEVSRLTSHLVLQPGVDAPPRRGATCRGTVVAPG
mmetsp:Transcript_9064/g.22189  ORF Transcript_9064/g.22189 Transcript_9064/m.22189 type:complete len:259 (+) Transcript_9064:1347-2123(+)